MAILILLVAFASLFASPTTTSTTLNTLHNANIGFQVALKHLDSDKNLTKTELLKSSLRRGMERMKWIQAMTGQTGDIDNPIRQVSDGFLMMNMSIGTPPQSFSAIIDTGSDLTWTQCKPCSYCFKQLTPLFDPKKSTSYSTLSCASDLCKELPPGWYDCNNNGSYCEYFYQYADYSLSHGALATETFTFPQHVSFPKVGFGCGVDNQLASFEGSVDGIVGLGRGGLSLVSQLHEKKFSYCVPSFGSTKTGFLSMGSRVNSSNPQMTTTRMVKNSFSSPTSSLYYLSLKGITIGDTRLPIDSSTFAINSTDGMGGLVIDSGTTITYLEDSVYDQVMKEVTRQIKLPTMESDDLFSDLCFNLTHPGVKFPKLVFRFEGGDLELPRDNVFFISGKPRRACLMMGRAGPSSNGPSVIGHFQQQNMLVVYDLSKQTVSFLPNARCDKLM